MSTTAIVLVVVGALVAVAIIAFAAAWVRVHRHDQRREEAREARLAAEEARMEQAAAQELYGKANDLDPDMDDADAATARGREDTATAEADEWVHVMEPRSR